MKARPSALALLGCVAAANVACLRAMDGVAVPRDTIYTIHPIVTASESDGLRVLWHGGRFGPVYFSGGWLANDASELATLWREARIPGGPAPHVDFSRYVVFGAALQDGPCMAEIDRAESDGRAVWLLGKMKMSTCEDSLDGVAQVVAIPRRIAPRYMVVVPFSEVASVPAWAFVVRPPPPSEEPTLVARAAPMPSSGAVETPAKGHLRLAALADGTEVWVVHRADDSISVLAATLPYGADMGYVGQQVMEFRTFRGVSQMLSWEAKYGRFNSDHDSHGRNVQGGPSVPSYSFRRLGASQLEVLPLRAPDYDGPVEPPGAAPVLDGGEVPYASRAALQNWSDVPEGRVEELDASVVYGVDGPARLCTVPDDTRFKARVASCPATAPSVVGEPSQKLRSVVVFRGPVVVRKRGGVPDLIVVRHGWEPHAAP